MLLFGLVGPGVGIKCNLPSVGKRPQWKAGEGRVLLSTVGSHAGVFATQHVI